MRKSMILAVAALAMVACNKEEGGPALKIQATDGAVGFSAYVSTPVTKGTVEGKTTLNEKGVGVFAFYQAASNSVPTLFNSRNFATPDFMYNQKVSNKVSSAAVLYEASELTTIGGVTYVTTSLKDGKVLYDSPASGQNIQKNVLDEVDPVETYTDADLTDISGTTYVTASLNSGALYGDSVAGHDVAKNAGDNKVYLLGDLTEIGGVTYVTSTLNDGKVLYGDSDASHDIQKNVGDVKTPATYADTWEYSPVKYWPNNDGDRLSFFAYAPYESGKAWDSMDISTDAVASKLTVGFAIADEVSSQKDLLWADPLINQTNKKTGNVNDLTNNLSFVFKHVTSKVDIEVGVAQSGTTAGAWTDEDTDITIKSIVFSNLYDGFDYVYPITDGAIGTAASNNDHASKFDLTVLPCAAAATIDDSWAPAGGYRKYLASDQFMFLAPQTFTAGTETVTITYTVKTTATDASNGSEITNAITKDMVSFLSSGITAGQAYKLKFLIGMDDVNITASTSDWEDATDSKIDVPQNE